MQGLEVCDKLILVGKNTEGLLNVGIYTLISHQGKEMLQSILMRLGMLWGSWLLARDQYAN
jgi:hypothetical protein